LRHYQKQKKKKKKKYKKLKILITQGFYEYPDRIKAETEIDKYSKNYKILNDSKYYRTKQRQKVWETVIDYLENNNNQNVIDVA